MPSVISRADVTCLAFRSIVRAAMQAAVAESREQDGLTRNDLNTLADAAWAMFVDDMKEVAGGR